jgi:membrane protease YdiL (CAAX protease family)
MTTSPAPRPGRLRQWQLSASPWKQTVVESLLIAPLGLLGTVSLGAQLTGPFFRELSLQLRPSDAHLAGWFWGTVALAVLAAPLIEELVFRGLGLWLRRRPQFQQRFWLIGVGSATLYALAHGAADGSHFALSQFLFGLIAWRAAARRGLRHAVFMHVWMNLFATLVLSAVFLMTVSRR